MELAASSSDVNQLGAGGAVAAGGGEEAKSGERMEIREVGKDYEF